MTNGERCCAVLGGMVGGALMAWALVWSAGVLVDPSQIRNRLRRNHG